MPKDSSPLLEVRDLHTVFETEEGQAHAVAGASFEIQPGEAVGLVGESGCGKSATALSILRLVPHPGRIVSGDIRFAGQSLLEHSEADMRALRGREISIVFQEPSSSLNPVFTCGDQVAEMFRVHQGASRRESKRLAVGMLGRVHLPDPEEIAGRYPHELSGGMCQRVMIAMALSCNPSLLIADEPTTALDVTIQAQICDLLREMRSEFHMALLLITHDLGLVSELADRVAIMYAGRVVENGSLEHVFHRPRHPYTRGLLASLPSLDVRQEALPAIPGSVVHPAHLPSHCPFHARCDFRVERCAQEDPKPRVVGSGHTVRCFVDVEADPPASVGEPA